MFLTGGGTMKKQYKLRDNRGGDQSALVQGKEKFKDGQHSGLFREPDGERARDISPRDDAHLRVLGRSLPPGHHAPVSLDRREHGRSRPADPDPRVAVGGGHRLREGEVGLCKGSNSVDPWIERRVLSTLLKGGFN